MDFGTARRGAPRIALLTARWGGQDETCWALRQVAGALSLCAEVHVVTPGGTSKGVRPDGVFVVHDLASEDRTARLRRELACAALAMSDARGGRVQLPGRDEPAAHEPSSLARVVRDLLCDGTGNPWDPAVAALQRINPDLVVVAGHRELGALRALEAGAPDTAMLLLPLRARWPEGEGPGRAERALCSAVLDRARCALVFTEAERHAFEALLGPDRVRWVGLPMSANPNVENEPNTYVGEGDYLLVLSARPLEDEATAPWTELLRLGSEHPRVAVCASDASVVYEDGVLVHPMPSGRGSDLLRLMAWATATVDLHPGSLFGRRSLESLLFGTPVVVPSDSVAAEHAVRGNGGLWFDGPAQMTWCAQAMFKSPVRAALGRQGQHYARERYGSTAAFVERVVSAAELAARSDVSPSYAGL